MITNLKDGHVEARVYKYVQSWLDQKDKELNKPVGNYLRQHHKKDFLVELTTNEFWLLFHRACNDDMQDKF